jgi:hypothetical protein
VGMKFPRQYALRPADSLQRAKQLEKLELVFLVLPGLVFENKGVSGY